MIAVDDTSRTPFGELAAGDVAALVGAPEHSDAVHFSGEAFTLEEVLAAPARLSATAAPDFEPRYSELRPPR